MRIAISNTPWGLVQQQETIADGIESVSTASHGGFWLAPERWQRVATLFPTQQRYAPDQWLEEDCDWALAVLAWPELFSERDCYYAARIAEGTSEYFAPTRAWLKTSEAAAVLAKAAQYNNR